jgi:hypothetical protein
MIKIQFILHITIHNIGNLCRSTPELAPIGAILPEDSDIDIGFDVTEHANMIRTKLNLLTEKEIYFELLH